MVSYNDLKKILAEYHGPELKSDLSIDNIVLHVNAICANLNKCEKTWALKMINPLLLSHNNELLLTFKQPEEIIDLGLYNFYKKSKEMSYYYYYNILISCVNSFLGVIVVPALELLLFLLKEQKSYYSPVTITKQLDSDNPLIKEKFLLLNIKYAIEHEQV